MGGLGRFVIREKPLEEEDVGFLTTDLTTGMGTVQVGKVHEHGIQQSGLNLTNRPNLSPSYAIHFGTSDLSDEL